MTAEEFKAIRQKMFGSTYKAAAALGVRQGAVCHWEHGRRKIPAYVKIILGFLADGEPYPGLTPSQK